MAFIQHGIEGAADWIGDLGAKVSGADDVIAAQEQAAAEARRQAELTQQQAKQSAQGMQDALGTAQQQQQAGFQNAMGALNPYAQRGQGYSQQLNQMLQQGPQDSQFRGQMLDIINQGPSDLRGDILSKIQSGTPVSQELQDAIRAPLEPFKVGPLEESRGYETMKQARQEGLRDLSTQMGGLGKFFSGSTARGAADISGRLAQDLERQQYHRALGDYQRAVGERDRNISNLFNLSREEYGRERNRLGDLMSLEGQDYARGQQQLGNLFNLDQQSYGREQDYLNRITQGANQGQNLAQLMSQMMTNQGNLQGGQTLANQANIANILAGGLADSSNLIGQAGRGSVDAAKSSAQSRSDLFSAIAEIIGSASKAAAGAPGA
jgi:hypothetical protein